MARLDVLGGMADEDEPNADFKNLMGMLNHAHRAANGAQVAAQPSLSTKGRHASIGSRDDDVEDMEGWGSEEGDEDEEDDEEEEDDELSSSEGLSDEEEEDEGGEEDRRSAAHRQPAAAASTLPKGDAGLGTSAGTLGAAGGPQHKAGQPGSHGMASLFRPISGDDYADDDAFTAALMAGVGEELMQGFSLFGGEVFVGEEDEEDEGAGASPGRGAAAAPSTAQEPGANIRQPQPGAPAGAGGTAMQDTLQRLEAVLGGIDFADMELSSEDLDGAEAEEQAEEEEGAQGPLKTANQTGGAAGTSSSRPPAGTGAAEVSGANGPAAGSAAAPSIHPGAGSREGSPGILPDGHFTSLLQGLRQAAAGGQLPSPAAPAPGPASTGECRCGRDTGADVMTAAAATAAAAAGAVGPEGQEALGEQAPGPLGVGHLLLEPFVELEPGQPRTKGRLGALYAALAANRAVKGHLRDVLLPRLDRAIDENWRHTEAVRAAPEAQRANRAAAQRQTITARDPIRQLAPTSQPQGPRRHTRHWVVEGEVPAPNQETLDLANQLSALPATYERTRWSARLMKRLRAGVEAEVHAQMSQEVLNQIQAAAQQGLEAAAAGRAAAAPGATIAELNARFAAIGAVTADSPEAAAMAARFTDEQWARISHLFVKDRSPVDCKVFWLHSLSPSVKKEWTDEEMRRLQQLVAQHGQQAWEAVAQELGNGRTPAQCVRQWLKGARPAEPGASKGRTVWSPEDCALLEKLHAEFGSCRDKWVKISAAFNGKFDRHQVRDRWHGQHAAQRHSRNIGRWSPDEDERLTKAVQAVGRQWRVVSAQVGTRTAPQCRERYENVLNPDVASGPFTEEEVAALRAAVAEVQEACGRIQWAKVAQRMPTKRTDDMCRRAWTQLETRGEVVVGKASQQSADGPKRGRSRKRPAASAPAARGRRGKAARSRLAATASAADAAAGEEEGDGQEDGEADAAGTGDLLLDGAPDVLMVEAEVQLTGALPPPQLIPQPLPGGALEPVAGHVAGPSLAETAARAAQLASSLRVEPLPAAALQGVGQPSAAGPRRSRRTRQPTRMLADYEGTEGLLMQLALPPLPAILGAAQAGGEPQPCALPPTLLLDGVNAQLLGGVGAQFPTAT